MQERPGRARAAGVAAAPRVSARATAPAKTRPKAPHQVADVGEDVPELAYGHE